MYFATHFYFCFYHTLSNMALRKVFLCFFCFTTHFYFCFYHTHSIWRSARQFFFPPLFLPHALAFLFLLHSWTFVYPTLSVPNLLLIQFLINLLQVATRYCADRVRWFFSAVLIATLSYITAFMEALTISGVRGLTLLVSEALSY